MQARLLCFDEMQIPDVGTAGILYRLFTHLHDYGVVVVATSNRPPSELYQGSFKESLFEPFVEVLETSCSVLRIDSETDYRALMPESASVDSSQQGVWVGGCALRSDWSRAAGREAGNTTRFGRDSL